jgi:hypothetical protein
VSSWKSEVSSQEGPASRSLTSNGTLHTSNSSACKTNPIWSARAPTAEAKCAKRSQFGPAGGWVLEAKGAERTQFGPGRRRVAEEIMQNEPNSARPEGQMCRTNPISRREDLR